MSSERLKQLLIAFVVLLFLWGAAEILGTGGDDGGTDFRLVEAPLSAVTRIEIRKGDELIAIERIDLDEWEVNGHEASSQAITSLFRVLQDTTLSSQLVALSPTSHERMGVDQETGRHLTLLSEEDELAHLIFGNLGTGPREIYVRHPDEAEVFAVRGDLAREVSRSLTDWRERQIAAVDQSAIARWEITREDGSYALEAGPEGWTFSDGSPADSGQVARSLGRFQNLSASGFASDEQEAEADFTSPEKKVVLLGESGDTLVALALEESDGSHLVRSAGSTSTFRLSDFIVNRIAPADTLLRP